jgi:hypothetical protein
MGDYRLGASLWTQDYPRADRHFARALRRLSRIDVRSVEQVVNLDDDDGTTGPDLHSRWASGSVTRGGAKLRDAARRLLHG